jgi:hypothetical protein
VDAPAVLELTLPTDRGLAVPLGTIELDSETAARPIELRLGGELNTYADVVVLVNGRPAPRACVRVASAEAPRALASLGVASQEGRARVGPVPPGPLQIEIVDPEQDWTWIHTAQPVAAAGVVNTIVVDVPVHAGTVHFTDSSGMPLSHARLSLVYSGAVIARQVTTDSEGRVKLSYPPGQLYPARIGAPGDPWGSNSKGAFEAVALPWPAAAESFVKLP